MLCSAYVFGQNYTALKNIIATEQKSKLLKNSSWSVTAKYLDNSDEIIKHSSHLALAPASNLKLLTTAVALDILGEDYQFVTKVYSDGEVDVNGNLDGNIYIVGGGDPTLGFNLVEGSLPLNDLVLNWIKAFREKGIKSISGNIIADDLLYDRIPIPDNWAWIDLGNYYAASTSALTIHNNLYYLYFKPADKVGELASVIRTEPYINDLKFTNFMKTGEKGSGDNGYIYNAPLQNTATLRGTIPMGKSEFTIKGSIPNPPLFASQYLKDKLIVNGINVNGVAKVITSKRDYKNNKLITVTYSPKLRDIVFIINKKSDNLYTEMLLKAIGYKGKGEGSVEKGIEVIKNYFNKNKLNSDELLMHDGCGLSRSNAITTNLMVNLLSTVYQKKYFKTFFNSLAFVGNPNDISSYSDYGIGTPIEMNAHIKSGVIQGVRAFSGYLNDLDGRTIVFSMIANNFNGNGGEVSNIHKKIMIELAKLKK
jgi:D-alanyl-D-alanine carboxypeptidase/D-alanyl-D-alanine-endopeptidase (penicillin-binding protein 4)